MIVPKEEHSYGVGWARLTVALVAISLGTLLFYLRLNNIISYDNFLIAGLVIVVVAAMANFTLIRYQKKRRPVI